MGIKHIKTLLPLLGIMAVCACHHKPAGNKKTLKKTAQVVYKGLYSFGPDIKSFKDCKTGREFWVTDSSAQLELQYSQLGFEKPDEPVYIEVQGTKSKPAKDSIGSDYDSILVVKNLIKITKNIPKGMCD